MQDIQNKIAWVLEGGKMNFGFMDIYGNIYINKCGLWVKYKQTTLDEFIGR